MYRGDIRLGATIDIKFTTRRFTTGATYTLAGSPVISAYVDNGTTQITAGITLTVDFDSVTGLHNVRVVASGGNGFAAGTNVDLVITTGTVDSVSVVGEVIGSFSIENRSAVMPTTSGRTLDVSAGGEAGVDWANVGSPTTTVGLSGTTVKTATDVETDTADIQSRLPAALVSGRIDSSVGAMANNVLTNSAIANDAISDSKINADAELSASAIAAAVWDYLTSALTTASSVGKLVADNLNATITSRASQTSVDTVDDFLDTEIAAIKGKTDNLPSDPADESLIIAATDAIYARLGAPAGASVSADVAAVKVDTAAVKAKTDNLPASPAAVGSAMTLTSGERNSVADALLTRDMSVVTGEAARSVLNAMRFLRNKWSIAAGTLTVTKEDDATSAWTAAVTQTAGNPVSTIDPA